MMSIAFVPKRSVRDALRASFRATARTRVTGLVLEIEPAAMAGALIHAAGSAGRALLACPDEECLFWSTVRAYLHRVQREEA